LLTHYTKGTFFVNCFYLAYFYIFSMHYLLMLLFQLSLTVLFRYKSLNILFFREWVPYFQTNLQESSNFLTNIFNILYTFLQDLYLL